ncbi:MAG TPA: SGNH hydrolase domain-containing protein, partial [Steroidobacteraceae bacterium]
LSRTLQALENEGEKVVIVGPVPEVSAYVPEALAKQRYFGIRKDIRPALPEFNRRQGFVLGVLTDVARKYPVTVLYPHRVLCPEAHCMVEQNGYALYADANHLSTHGAGLLTREMEAAF